MNPIPRRILLIANQEVYSRVHTLLKGADHISTDLRWVSSDQKTAVNLISSHPWDAVFVEYKLNGQNSVELVREAISKGCKFPFYVILEDESYEIKNEAIQAGAADCISKTELTASVLEQAIRYTVDRQQAETALNTSNAVLEGLLELSPDGILLVDHAGTIRRANRRALAIFGFSLDEMLGKTVEFLLPNRLRAKHAKLRQNYNAQPDIRSMGIGRNIIGTHKDGRELPLFITLSPLLQGDDQLVITMIRDISEQKTLEAELQRRLMDGREAERLFLSQELHDGPIQDLLSAIYSIKALHDQITQVETEKLALALTSLESSIQQAAEKLRSICVELRPPTLAPYGLESTILSSASRFQQVHPEIQVSLDLTKDGLTLPETVRLALFRIYQQTMSNIVRHANARNVSIRFKVDAKQILLEIQDDGQGFCVPDRWIEFAREGHLGLVGNAERAEAIGGNLQVESQPGQGTTVRVILPR